MWKVDRELALVQLARELEASNETLDLLPNDELRPDAVLRDVREQEPWPLASPRSEEEYRCGYHRLARATGAEYYEALQVVLKDCIPNGGLLLE